MARAIWKGTIELGKHAIGVKMYSAVEDRTVHFHMLHRTDHAPVEQHIVRKDTGNDVAKEDMRKAFAVTKDTRSSCNRKISRSSFPRSRERFSCVDSSRLPCSVISGTNDLTTLDLMRMRTVTSRSHRH